MTEALTQTAAHMIANEASETLPEPDDLFSTLPNRHPVLAREVCEVMATSPLGAHARQGLLEACQLPMDAHDELCLQIVEEEQQRREELGLNFKEDFRASLPVEERRWKARAMLKTAMHERRLDALRAAIAEGEAAELYAVELDYARNIMDEEVKATVRAELKEAREKLEKPSIVYQETREVDVCALRRCIKEAQQIGLSDEQIHTAEKVLADEIERMVSKQALLDALKNGSLEHLKAAVARAESAGLAPSEIDRTKNAMVVQQRKADAREGLSTSEQARDIDQLKAAIKEAQMAKLRPSEADAAKEILEIEKRKIEALADFKTAEILLQGGDVERYRAAVKEGQDAGLTESQLAGPLETLAMEDLKISARRNLEFARTGGKGGKITKERMLEITLAAVSEGEACGLSKAELSEARELLVEAKKADARVALGKAVESRDVAAIRAAMSLGESVGLSHLAFFEAKNTIVEVETQHEVLERLAKALAGRKIFEMKGAIKEGMGISLPETEFAEIRIALAEEERMSAARSQIQDGIQAAIEFQEQTEQSSGKTEKQIQQQNLIIQRLDAAAEEGGNAGLQEDEINPASHKALSIRQANAREALAEAVKKKSIEALQAGLEVAFELEMPSSDLEIAMSTLAREERRVAAIAALKEAIRTRVIGQLRPAISEGSKVVMGSREVNDAKKVLKEEERRLEAREGLVEAIKTRKLEKLQRWIGKAEGAGLQNLGSEELAAARVVLAEEERKEASRVALEAALEKRCVQGLRMAAREALDAGVEPHELERANQILAEELPKVARAGLETALAGVAVGKPAARGQPAPEHIKELRAAINEGVTVGLEAAELNHPRLVLGELQISEALKRKAAYGIRQAIQDGEVFGVDALTMENARQVLAVEEKKEIARKQLRDSEESRRIDEIMVAMGHARAAGLQDWEFDFAEKVLQDERRRSLAKPARPLRSR